MTPLLVLAIALYAPAPLVLAAVYGWRAIRSAMTPTLLFVGVPVMVERAARREALALVEAPASRGDLVGIVGTPLSAQVVCVHGSVAWCRIGRPQLSGLRIIDPLDTPQPVPVSQLAVLERDVPVVGDVN